MFYFRCFSNIIVSIINKIQEIVTPLIGSKDVFLVDVEIKGTQAGKIIEIFIDTDNGVTTNLCAEISRLISPELDAANLFQHRYHLVVSSPGTDRPLKYLRQYPKNIGRQLIVKIRTDKGSEKIQGTLTEVAQDAIGLRIDGVPDLKVLFKEIIEARVIASL
jgi:ribosome maturation factor RimP